MRKSEQLKNGSDVIGNHVKCKVVKNKVAPPFRTAEFDIIYGKGISNESEIIELGIANGVIDKSGSWLSYNGEKLGQGKDKVRMLLEEDKPLAEEIREKIMAVANGGNAPVHEDAVSADSLFDEDAE